jgi:hypothetical protein
VEGYRHRSYVSTVFKSLLIAPLAAEKDAKKEEVGEF